MQQHLKETDNYQFSNTTMCWTKQEHASNQIKTYDRHATKHITWVCDIYTKTGIGETKEMMFSISVFQRKIKSPFYKTLTKYNQVQL
jgi:hypothetical protein